MRTKLREESLDSILDFLNNEDTPRISLAHIHPKFKQEFLSITKDLKRDANFVVLSEDAGAFYMWFLSNNVWWKVVCFYDSPVFDYQL